MIVIKEYAKIHNLEESGVRQRCNRGTFLTSVKIGNQWFIDEREYPVNWNIRSVEAVAKLLESLEYSIITKNDGLYFLLDKKEILIPNNMAELKKLLSER